MVRRDSSLPPECWNYKICRNFGPPTAVGSRRINVRTFVRVTSHFKQNPQINLKFSIKDLCIPNFCSKFAADLRNSQDMSKGQYAVVSPELTGLTEGVKGEVINVRQNPFIGQEIAVRDANGRIYFGESKYFTAI